MHCDVGEALARQARLDEAQAELCKAVDLDSRYAPARYQLGLVLDRKGHSEEAIGQWQEALRIDPHFEDAHDSLAQALYARGDIAGALSHWREGARDAANLRRMAWVLATCPDASIRDGREAVALAVRAVELSGGKDAAVCDTLAAAYAESGRFADAVLTARRALALAKSHLPGFTLAIEGRLRLYQTGSAFRETPVSARP